MRPAESFVGQPIRSLQTMLRVISQEDPAIPAPIPDGVYGPSTQAAVNAFQRRYGLPVTGVADQATWEAIVEVYEDAIIRVGKAEPIEVHMDPGSVYRLGDYGPNIYLTQSLLIQLALELEELPSPEHSGTLDSLTAESLGVFQRLAGLPVTGQLDRITWHHLARQYSLNAHHNMRPRET